MDTIVKIKRIPDDYEIEKNNDETKRHRVL